MQSHNAKSLRPLYPFVEGGSSSSAAVWKGQGTDGAIGGNGLVEAEIEEASRDPKVARRPNTPTKAQVEAHMTLHADYRDWCPHCVYGRGISHHHASSKGEKLGNEFSLDYAFMTAEEVGEDMCPVLVGFDHNSKGIWALAVDQKGATRSSTKWVTGKIDEAGCAGIRVSIRSDQEESIMALKKAVAVYRQSETVLLESPVRDSQANGAAERAVRSWAGQLRTLRHHLESRLKCPMNKDSALMTWLVSWAADVIFRYHVNTSGRTAYELITGHRCNQPVAGFAEKIHFKFTTDKNHRQKMLTEWSTGFFVGINGKTTEYLVATEEGIFSCTTIRRLPDEEAYDPRCLDVVKVTYREYVLEGASSNPVGVRFAQFPATSDSRTNPDPAPLTGPTVPRRARLTPDDFHKFGFTVGCGGCEQIQTGSAIRKNHSQICRDRIEDELTKSDAGQHRLNRAKDRLDARVVEIGESMMDAPEVVKEVSTESAPQSGQGEQDTFAGPDRLPSSPLRMAGRPKPADEDMQDALESEFEDSNRLSSDTRMGTPDRNPPVKRRGDPDEMEEDFKNRRVAPDRVNKRISDPDDMDDDGIKRSRPEGTSPTRIDDEMLGNLDAIDRKILASVILGVDITEVYSPDRVAKVARSFGLVAGSSFDLTNGWDFCREDHKRMAWKRIREESPYLLIGSPPCTYFSMLQELNVAVHGHKPEWKAKFEEAKRKAITHIEFCCSLYKFQIQQGRHFLHEHPWSARSWALPCVQRLLDHPSVELTQAHMCRFRMTTHVDTKNGERGLVKKPTGFMSSSRFINRELDQKCEGGHAHIPLVGGRAAGAQVYPQDLCESICKGVYKQKEFDKLNRVSTSSMTTGEVRLFANHICSLQHAGSHGIREFCPSSRATERLLRLEDILSIGPITTTRRRVEMIAEGSDPNMALL